MTVKVDVQTVDSVRRRLAVEVPAEEVGAEVERAYAQLSRGVRVPGFRPGRVPRTVLERLFGDRVRAEVFARLIQHSYSEAIEERHIEPLGQPEIVTEQAQVGTALRYSATIEVKPELTVADYAGLAVERPLQPVTDADVGAALERLRQSLAQLQPITDRTRVEPGDVVTLDYEARADGRLVGRAERREVEAGANGFPPEFDTHLIGAGVGATLQFAAVYPPDHGASELAGKTLQFVVHVQALSHKQVPPLDDDFAKDQGECATLDELRANVRRRLEAEAAERADDAVRQALLARLTSTHDIAVPNALVQQRTEVLVREVQQDWQRQRLRPRDEDGMLARLRAELEPRAREQVKAALLLEAIARHAGVAVSDDDVARHIDALAAAAGTAAERVRALYAEGAARRQLRSRLLQSRALDAVVARAHVTTITPAASVAEARENG